MSEKLVIVIHANTPAQPAYVLLDQQRQITKLVLQCDGSELAQAANGREVIVIVPAEDVLLASVTLPKMNRARLLQAIPFALEEQIIEDVDTLHFAAGDFRPNEPVPVLVAARTKMNDWMALLQSWHVTADNMIPAIFALPVIPQEWYVLANHTVVVRTGVSSGFACDKQNLAELLNMSLEGLALPPQIIRVENDSAEPLALSLPVTIEQQQITAEKHLEIIAFGAVQHAPVDLLQGDYASKKSRHLPKLTMMLKIIVYLAAAWLSLLFLYPVVSFGILDRSAADLDSQAAVIYKKYFPNAPNLAVARDRMQQKLNKLSSGVSENHLLTLMASIGKGLTQSSGVQLKRMDYQNNVMTLEIAANNSKAFSIFTDALSQQGLRVTQQNANLNGARVSATLQIE